MRNRIRTIIAFAISCIPFYAVADAIKIPAAQCVIIVKDEKFLNKPCNLSLYLDGTLIVNGDEVVPKGKPQFFAYINRYERKNNGSWSEGSDHAHADLGQLEFVHKPKSGFDCFMNDDTKTAVCYSYASPKIDGRIISFDHGESTTVQVMNDKGRVTDAACYEDWCSTILPMDVGVRVKGNVRFGPDEETDHFIFYYNKLEKLE